MGHVAVGRLTGVFGLRGELKCKPGSFGDEPFAPGRRLRLGPEPAARELRCADVRRQRDRLLLAFETIDTPEAARSLVGAELFAERRDVALAPGEYFDADLIGLRLIDAGGRERGPVVGIEHFPAQDCLVVGPGRTLVPLVKAFVQGIDLDARTIRMSLPEGLLE